MQVKTMNEIKKQLQQKKIILPTTILETIESTLKLAIEEGNERDANYYWCLRQVYSIQEKFTRAFKYLQIEKYEDSWLLLDQVDTEISFLEGNIDCFESIEPYNIPFILTQIKEYQKLFPYRYFLSRESIIKSERCSICNRELSLRNPCNHVPGKLYMGSLCTRVIMDMEFKAMCLVRNSYDKYTFIKIQDQEYDYGMLKKLLTVIKNPYDPFRVEIRKVTKPEFINAKRNSLCPCGSGKKYKHCHNGTSEEIMNHFVVYTEKNVKGKIDIQYFSTWK